MENNKHCNIGADGEHQASKRPASLIEVVCDSLEKWAREDNRKRGYIFLTLFENEKKSESRFKTNVRGNGWNQEHLG